MASSTTPTADSGRAPGPSAGWSVNPNIEWIPGDYFVNSSNTVENEAWTTLGFRAEVLPADGRSLYVGVRWHP